MESTNIKSYPIDYQDAFREAQDKYFVALASEHGVETVLGLKTEDMESVRQKAVHDFQEYQKSREGLYKNGAHVPYVRVNNIFFVNEKRTTDEVNQAHDLMSRVSSDLIEEIFENQSSVDQLYIDYQTTRKKNKVSEDVLFLSKNFGGPFFSLIKENLNHHGGIGAFSCFLCKGLHRDQSIRLCVRYGIPAHGSEIKENSVLVEINLFPSPEAVKRVRRDILSSDKLDV